MRIHRAFFVAYVATVIAAGAALLAATWLPSGDPMMRAPERFVFWLFLSLAAESVWTNTSNRAAMISMSLVVNVATLFILPLPQVLMIGAVTVIASDLVFHRRGWLRAYFNGAQTALAMWASLLSMRLIAGVLPGTGRSFILEHPFAAMAGIAIFFIANTGLVAGVISLHGRSRYLRVWKENFGFGYHFFSSSIMSLLGLTLVLASESAGYMVGFVYLLFILFVRDAYQRFARNRAAGMTTGS